MTACREVGSAPHKVQMPNATTLQGQGSPTGLGRNIYMHMHIGCYFLLGCVYSNAKINLHYTGTP